MVKMPSRPVRRRPRVVRTIRQTRRLVQRQRQVPPPRLTRVILKRNLQQRIRNLRLNNPRLGVSTVGGFSTSDNTRRPRLIRDAKPLTKEGEAFLQCAFAPPDFSQTKVLGIPDSLRCPTLLKKHKFNNPITFSASTGDTYLLLLPVPGVAYWYAYSAPNVPPSATTQWTAVYYSDYMSLFGSIPSATNAIVNSFRFLSNHIELICTANQMSWSGGIQAWKMPVKILIDNATTTLALSEYTISGLAATTSTNSNRYVGNFFDGFFSGCFNFSAAFDFSTVLTNIGTIPSTLQTSDFGQLLSSSGIPGFDNNMESMVVKVSGVIGTETAIIRTWACVEYTPLPNSDVYEYSSISPPEDVTALKAYREIAIALPVGVPAAQNGEFWNRVLRILYAVTGALSVLPGAPGLVSRGANMITAGMQSLST